MGYINRYFRRTVRNLSIDGGGISPYSHMSNVEYHRLDVPLNGCSEEMDDAAQENMECFKKMALDVISQSEKSLQRMVEL